jgi:hypothetical protein
VPAHVELDPILMPEETETEMPATDMRSEPEVLVKLDVAAMLLLAPRRSLSPVSLIGQTQRRFDIL